MCLQVAVDGLARILCMSELIDKNPAKTASTAHHSRSHVKDRRPAARNQSEPGYSSCVQASPAPVDAPGLVDRSPVHCPVSPALEADVRDIRRMLKNYVTRLETKDAAARVAKEWRIVARVLDRLFFFCYIGTIIVSLVTVFPISHMSTTPNTSECIVE